MMEPKGVYGTRGSMNRAVFNGICALVLFFLLYDHNSVRNTCGFGGHFEVIRRRIYEVNVTDTSIDDSVKNNVTEDDPVLCAGLSEHKGYNTSCDFLLAHPKCNSSGYLDYIRFLYCDCKGFHVLGYVALIIWLVALFYLLGNTAADYFCCSLEKLSSLLRLPPTVAGVSLLPLGNGAPDVSASIAAFVGKDAGDVGLNCVLGGAVFVTCIVVGAVSLTVTGSKVQIDRKCFIRDICFFLIVILSLGAILLVGEVTVAGAIAFVCIYLVYAFMVAANEILKNHAWRLKLGVVKTLLPVRGGSEEDESVYSLLLDSNKSDVPHLHKLPRWMWASHVAIYSNDALKSSTECQKSLWGWNEEDPGKELSGFRSKIISLLEMPSVLPRQLTITIIEEEQWSKGYAVASASLAPILTAFLWNTKENMDPSSAHIAYIIGAAFGGILGVLAYVFTCPDHPPCRFLFPWVFGGFFMSIIWFYIVANELVALLVALGLIFEVSPSILGLTVLAWGNSMGDFMSNVALASNGGDSVQIAMSGCYAGPMFKFLLVWDSQCYLELV